MRVAIGMRVGLKPEFFSHFLPLACAMAAYCAVYLGVGNTREGTGSLSGRAAVIWMAAFMPYRRPAEDIPNRTVVHLEHSILRHSPYEFSHKK